MKKVVYRRHDGSIVKYDLKEVKQGSFSRYGIFDSTGKEVEPEDRQEHFVKYED